MKVPWPLSEPRSFGLASGLKGFTPSSKTRSPIRNSGWDIEPLGPALSIGPLAPPLTFAVSPPGWMTWVLTHPRNLVTRSAMDWLSAQAEELRPRRPAPALIKYRLWRVGTYPVLADSEPDQKFRVGFAPRKTYPCANLVTPPE